jgi:magnesium-protoporphyrin O-methyltransferase
LLEAVKLAGKLFPRSDRSPAIEPVAEKELRQRIAAATQFAGWTIGRTHRVKKPFYISQAMELVRA